MQKIARYIYSLLKNAVIFSGISFLLARLSGEDNSFGNWFIGIAFYGTLISIYLFFIHILVWILSFVLKSNSDKPH